MSEDTYTDQEADEVWRLLDEMRIALQDNVVESIYGTSLVTAQDLSAIIDGMFLLKEGQERIWKYGHGNKASE